MDKQPLGRQAGCGGAAVSGLPLALGLPGVPITDFLRRAETARCPWTAVPVAPVRTAGPATRSRARVLASRELLGGRNPLDGVLMGSSTQLRGPPPHGVAGSPPCPGRRWRVGSEGRTLEPSLHRRATQLPRAVGAERCSPAGTGLGAEPPTPAPAALCCCGRQGGVLMALRLHGQGHMQWQCQGEVGGHFKPL